MSGAPRARAAGVLAVARSHPDTLCLSAVVLLALALRLSFALRVAPFITKDSQSYFLPGWDLVAGGPFQLGLRRTPGYSAFIAVALVLFGQDLRGLALAQHLLGAATVGLTYVLGRLSFNRAVGLGAAVLAAMSAPLIIFEHTILTESLFGFLLTAALVALVAAWRHDSGRRWLLGGLLVGASTLVRPIGQIVLPLGLLTALATGARSWQPATRRAGLVLLGFGLLVVPWTIRNQLEHNVASPSTFGRTLIARTAYYDRGFVFYDSDRPPAVGDSAARARQIVQQSVARRESDGTIAQRLRQELNLDGAQVNALMRDIALEAMARQPRYFVDGSIRFALRIFNGVEVRIRDQVAERKDVVWEDRTRHLLATGSDSEDDFRAASKLLGLYQPARFAPLPLALFSLGLTLALLVSRWRPAALVGLVAGVLILASAALDGPQERYRYPADPAIGVMAIGGLAAAWELARRWVGRARQPAVPNSRDPAVPESQRLGGEAG